MVLIYKLQASESLYDQKPEEQPVVPVSTSNNNTSVPSSGPSSLASRFEYVENVQHTETNSDGTQVLSHVAPPKSSGFFSDFGMDSGFQKKSGSYSSKAQVSIRLFTIG